MLYMAGVVVVYRVILTAQLKLRPKACNIGHHQHIKSVVILVAIKKLRPKTLIKVTISTGVYIGSRIKA